MDQTVVDNPSESRFEIVIDRHLAELVYHRSGKRLVLIHTEVPAALEGHGIAGRLVQAAVDTAEAEGLTIVPRCPYARAWLERHPDVAAGVDRLGADPLAEDELVRLAFELFRLGVEGFADAAVGVVGRPAQRQREHGPTAEEDDEDAQNQAHAHTCPLLADALLSAPGIGTRGLDLERDSRARLRFGSGGRDCEFERDVVGLADAG